MVRVRELIVFLDAPDEAEKLAESFLVVSRQHRARTHMNIQQTPTAVTESRERHSYARVSGRWLVLARVGWAALVVLTLAICFASLPDYVAQLHTPCAGSACGYQQLAPEQASALTGMGLFPGVYTAYIGAKTARLDSGLANGRSRDRTKGDSYGKSRRYH
jgi:hypothetical protein